MERPIPDDFEDMKEDSDKCWEMITLILDERPLPRQASIVFNLVGRMISRLPFELHGEMIDMFAQSVIGLRKIYVAEKNRMKSKSKFNIDNDD